MIETRVKAYFNRIQSIFDLQWVFKHIFEFPLFSEINLYRNNPWVNDPWFMGHEWMTPETTHIHKSDHFSSKIRDKFREMIILRFLPFWLSWRVARHVTPSHLNPASQISCTQISFQISYAPSCLRICMFGSIDTNHC